MAEMLEKLEKWRGFVPDEELETYRKGGFARRIGIGRRPALLNIDTTYMFVDPAYSQCGREDPLDDENILKALLKWAGGAVCVVAHVEGKTHSGRQ